MLCVALVPVEVSLCNTSSSFHWPYLNLDPDSLSKLHDAWYIGQYWHVQYNVSTVQGTIPSSQGTSVALPFAIWECLSRYWVGFLQALGLRWKIYMLNFLQT